jgi:hypothetical protein
MHVVERNNFRALPGSRADAEKEEDKALATSWAPKSATVASGVGLIVMSVAADHLIGFAHSLDPEEPTVYAPTTLARAALENSARTWWQLDPSIDTRARVARLWTEKLYNLWEIAQGHLMLPNGDSAQERIDEVVAEARRLNFNVVQGRGGVVAIGEFRPSATKVISRMLDAWGRAEYSRVSTPGHGTLGLLDMQTSDIEALRKVATTALVGFDIAADRATAHFGWSDDWSSWQAHLRKTLTHWAPETFARDMWADMSDDDRQLWRDAVDHRLNPHDIVRRRLDANDPVVVAMHREVFGDLPR